MLVFVLFFNVRDLRVVPAAFLAWRARTAWLVEKLRKGNEY
jgi:hypothetical protein